MLSFIREIQWENSGVNPIPWVQKNGWPTHIPNPKAGGMSVQYTWGTNKIE